MRRSTLVVAMCDVMKETFHCDVKRRRRPQAWRRRQKVQVGPCQETPLGRDSSHFGHVYIGELSLICNTSLGYLSLLCISLYWTSALSFGVVALFFFCSCIFSWTNIYILVKGCWVFFPCAEGFPRINSCVSCAWFSSCDPSYILQLLYMVYASVMLLLI
jgi:hypothetical protein